MPSGKHKSRTFRKVFVRTPGAKTVVHHRLRKPSRTKCGGCRKALSGVPRERPTLLKKIPRTARRPDRPYGGVLCSGCMRKTLVQKLRA